jgi:hypothetical protein
MPERESDKEYKAGRRAEEDGETLLFRVEGRPLSSYP